MTENFIRVAIIDDHPLMCDGVARALENECDIGLIGTGKLADASSLAELYPTVIIIGVNAPGSGLTTARRLATTHPSIRLIFLTISERHEDARAALEAGVRGYVLKCVSSADLVMMVRAVAAGETYVAPDLAVRLLVMPTTGGRGGVAIRNLSAREKQILDGVALGMTNKEIATRMTLSERTIKHHMTGVMRKLNVRNRVEAFLILRRSAAQEAQARYAS